MSKIERNTGQENNLVPELTNPITLSERIRARILFLKHGVQQAIATLQGNDDSDEELEGPDNGLYQSLVELANSLDYRVVDNDEVTEKILTGRKRGLRKRFVSGWVIMVKQGSPLQMSATLGHELAHHFIPRIERSWILKESVAEGSAFIVCDYFGFDISRKAFLYIAEYIDYIRGSFTPQMAENIEEISTRMISDIQEIKKLKEANSVIRT